MHTHTHSPSLTYRLHATAVIHKHALLPSPSLRVVQCNLEA